MKSFFILSILFLFICPAIAQTNKDSLNHPQPVLEQLSKPDDDIPPDPPGLKQAPTQQPANWVQVMPKFPGGDINLLQYIQQKIRYPKEAYDKKIQGRVSVRFIVGKDGMVRNAYVTKETSVGGGCDEEAVRVIMSLPKWTPGMQNGEPVDVWYTVPIIFKL